MGGRWEKGGLEVGERWVRWEKGGWEVGERWMGGGRKVGEVGERWAGDGREYPLSTPSDVCQLVMEKLFN